MTQPSNSGETRIGVAYIRVSTNDQMELSPESQLREIQKFSASNNITLSEDFIFMEKEGRSGKRAGNRPEFQRMIATAKTLPRPFDIILVWKFSRFARNQDESTFYKGMLRKKLGIDILSVSEPILDGMYGRLIELIIEWQDEFYSCNLSAEVRRGMAQKAQSGGYQSAFPYGYIKSGPGKAPTVVKEQAAVVRTIFALYTEDEQSFSAIARYLNAQGHTTGKGNPFEGRTISYILKNPFYTGTLCWNRRPGLKNRHNEDGEGDEGTIISAEGRHKTIISKELFEKAVKRMERDKRGPAVRNTDSCRHCLSGLLRCPVCGAGLSYNRSQSPSFQCWRYAKGLHSGSASISEKKVMKALEVSLLDRELNQVYLILKDTEAAEDEKGRLLRSYLQKISYDRNTGTFHFHYYV